MSARTYPLSQSQLGIYLTCMNSQEEGNYNLDMLYRLAEEVDLRRLASALEAVIAAHPYVKSRIVPAGDGTPVFEDRSDEEFRAAIIEKDSIGEVRALLGRDYNLLGDRLFRLEIYKTLQDGNWLYVDFHHIIFDGFSWSVFRDELAGAYDGETLQKEAVDGFKIALDEAALRESDAYREARDWYASEFGAGCELESMPLPDVYGQSEEHFAKYWKKLDIDTDSLKTFCGSSGYRESAVYTAAFGYTLSRFTAEDEVLFSTVYHGRTDKATRRSFTMMVKTLPVYQNFADGIEIAEVLEHLRAQTSQVRRHASYSFADAHDDLGINSDVSFAYQGSLHDFSISLGGKTLQGESLITHTPGLKFLGMLMIEEGAPHIWCEYQTNKFSPAFIEAFWETYECVVNGMCRCTKFSQIELCNPSQTALLDSFNSHYKALEKEETVLEAFRQTAAAYPDNIAVIYKDRHLTYRELDEMTDRIGSYIYSKIKDCGRQEPVVSILIGRSELMTVLPLAAMKAGAAYQPLDPSYPAERLNFMVKDADAVMLLADPELRGIVDEYKGEVLLTDALPGLPAPEPLPDCPGPESLFILLYTSGSTGVPKGVMLEHRNLMAFCRWYQAHHGIDPDSRTAAYASFGFDADMMDQYPALTCGAAVVIVPEETRLDLMELEKYFKKNGVTHSFITTQVGVQFLQSVEDCPSLRHLSIGGEKLISIDPPKDFAFHNVYGPTECTVFVTIKKVQKNEPNIPIGVATGPSILMVCDKNLKRLPVGAAGELIVIGDQVGRGYLNRPDKTAEAFFTVDGRRAYHTGDIVRYRTDGDIEFVGRRDGQVKIRGFRIELKEVEAVIREYPGVADCTVQAFDDPGGSKMIAAYVVAPDDFDAEALGAFIMERKPPYMVPAHTIRLERIPLNVNQKVDRRALPSPFDSQTAAPVAYEEKLSILGERIKAIIEGILKEDGFRSTDRLVQWGLSSISALRLATQVYKAFGVQLDSKALVSEGSLLSIENAVLEHMLKGAQEAPGEKKPAPQSDRANLNVPLSFTQQGVYAECQAHPDSLIYNMPLCLDFAPGVDAQRIRSAVLQVLDAHPYMACRFTTDEASETIQEPIPDFKARVEVSEMTEDEFTERRSSFVQPFDLSHGPLFRFEVVCHDGICSLLIDVHHLIGDGYSVDLLAGQICEAIDGKAPEKEKYSYYDFVRNQKEDKGAEEYFDAAIGGIEEVSRLSPDIFTEEPHELRSVSTKFFSESLEAFLRREEITPAAFFLTATALTLSRYLCEEDVSFATISNGRSNLLVSDTVGMFVNTLPIAVHTAAGASVRDFLHEGAAIFEKALEHENYPFARVASKYGFTPGVSYACQMGVLESLSTAEGAVRQTALDLDTAKIPIALYVNGSIESEIELMAEYDSGFYSESFVRHFIESIRNVAAGLQSADSLAEISLTTAADRPLLDSFNAELFTDFDRTDTAVSLFQKQVAAHPDKEAAVYGDKRYTYRELDEQTDRLASVIYEKLSRITGKTDLREEVVSIIIDRSEWVFLLPLAALKAGCAYEPLDPSYPAARLNYMVRDAGARLLIAQRDLAGLVSEYDGEILLTDDFAQYATESRVCKPEAGDLMLMLYTSGSTGNPKGVQIEHGNIVAFVSGVGASGFNGADSRVAAYASFGFDVCMMDTFCTLLNGGTLLVIPEDMRLDLGRLKDYMDTERITQIFMTTQVGVQFLQSYPAMETLRYLSMGGEKLPAVHPEGLSYKILNGYGPTENTCGVSQFPIEHWEPNIPLGRPMPTVLGYVLDRSGHRLPPGACGEYCVAGYQPARGYLGLPEKTAEVFGPLPDELNPTGLEDLRLYHTGDVVRYRENGDIEFVGRKDGMVKIRGFRIELKEVEAAIRPFEGVKDVTVQAYDYESGGKYLAAFVVSDDPAFSTSDLLEYVKSQKPPYMVPAIVTKIDRIPLTVNQKVDKKALPKPQLAAAAFVAPSGKTEQDFCEIFAEVLGQEKVSADSDFFEIGGSSIIALKVVVAAQKRGYQIVYNDVFSYTTAQAMAGHLGTGEAPAVGQKTAKDADKPQEIPQTGPDGFDYSAINALLRSNTMENFLNGEPQGIGEVLLAGATGFLGVHVLKDLIDNYECKVHCFVRAKGSTGAQQRLQEMLLYYFGTDCAALFGSRLFIVEGDATDPAALDSFRPENPSGITVINCAASVKHFSKGNEIENINVGSVRNIVRWCIRNGARLVHVSTGSVMGTYVGENIPDGFRFDEHILYAGQETDDNQYVHSKFMAERLIYDAILHNGLNAKVMRVGNLAPRDTDGKFQINYTTNNFMASLAAYRALGMMPYDAMDSLIEFSPINQVARAILLLATTPRECVCFMPSNNHYPHLGDVVMQMECTGKEIRMVEGAKFGEAIRAALSDPDMVDTMRPFVAYATNASVKKALGPDDLNVSHTLQVLYRLGFRWSETGADYVRKFLNELQKLDFFRK